jgi:hypothetical protein
MLSAKKWNYISNLKTLTRDEYGHMWTAENSLNGYLAYLPWWALDQKLNKTCLLYQVDSKGKLFILCIMYIVHIRTHPEGYTIIYSNDKEHARLHTYRITKLRLNKVGIMSIQPFGVSRASQET